jgi:hypothetical protein
LEEKECWKKKNIWGTNIMEFNFQRPVPLDPSPIGHKDFSDPAKTVQTFFSAIWNSDFDTWKECWVDREKEEIMAKRALDESFEAHMKDNWKKTRTGTKLLLTAFAAYTKDNTNYIFAGYTLLNEYRGVLHNALVLKVENNQWKVTDELKENPTFTTWSKFRNK